MGFFSKLFGTGSQKPMSFTINSPLNGEIAPASEIPDPTFSEGILGPTICFKPGSDGTIYAPCNGEVSQIFKTGHAIAITSDDRVEVLIHIGINTVKLKGEGFTALVKAGDLITTGQPLIKFDQDIIRKAGYSTCVPVVICNGMEYADVKFAEPGAITINDVACTIKPNTDN